MAWIDTGDCYDPIRVHLVDGYLARRNTLERLAEAEPLLGPCDRRPFRWEGHDLDSVYETLAFHARGNYCRHLPRNRKTPGWSEAWLLKPEEWPTEFRLGAEGASEDRRRLLVTLHEACPSGAKCVQNLVKKSRITVIPQEAYSDYEAFVRRILQLAEDVSMPFRAPCIVAEEQMRAQGYDYRTFGR